MAAPVKLPDQILIVAEKLGDQRSNVVFLGGMVRGILVTDPAVPGPRQTKDVDVIVRITSHVERLAFTDEIRALGFKEDLSEDAPICRYVLKLAFHGHDLPVDFMPLDEKIFGFSNRWYPSAYEHATCIEAPVGTIRVIDAPHYIATKLESFANRGQGDYAHHDIEDVVVVVDGRASLSEELEAAPADVRRYVSGTLRQLLNDAAFVGSLPWHLPPDEVGQSRLGRLEQRLHALTTDQT